MPTNRGYELARTKGVFVVEVPGAPNEDHRWCMLCAFCPEIICYGSRLWLRGQAVRMKAEILSAPAEFYLCAYRSYPRSHIPPTREAYRNKPLSQPIHTNHHES